MNGQAAHDCFWRICASQIFQSKPLPDFYSSIEMPIILTNVSSRDNLMKNIKKPDFYLK